MPEMGDKFCQAARGEFTGLINQINASPLRFWTPKDRNIEVLLKWLNRQKRRTQLTATGHAHNLRCREIIALTLQARSFILRETSKAPQIDELLSWGPLLRRQKVVDIFSLNYDTVVEDVCHRLRIPCYDGFSVHGAWAPKGLRNCPKGVRLWKIHGSVTWIEQQGLPVRISSPAQRQQAAGHQASLTEETALIWPALDKTAPESSLFHLFDETLRRLLPQYDLIVSVGYRFRDREIRNATLSSLRRNRNQRLVVACYKDNDEVVRNLRRSFPKGSNRISDVPGTFQEILRNGTLEDRVNEFIPLIDQRRIASCAWPDFDLAAPPPPKLQRRNWLSKSARLIFSTAAAEGRIHAVATYRRRLLVAAQDNRLSHLWLSDSARTGWQKLASFPSAISELTVQPDGTVWALDCNLRHQSLGRGALWRFNLGARLRVPVRLERFCVSRVHDPVSPDALKWPTSLQLLPGSRLLVSEANGVVSLSRQTGEIKLLHPRHFLNLMSVRGSLAHGFFLLEHVRGKEGVLWRMPVPGAIRRPLVSGLCAASSLAFSPDRRHLYFSLGCPYPQGRIYRVNLMRKTVQLVFDRLDFPGRFSFASPSELLVTTGHGLISLSLA